MSSLDESSLSPSCEYQENLGILRQTYFFSGLPLESLKIFAYLCTREKFREGEFLFRQARMTARRSASSPAEPSSNAARTRRANRSASTSRGTSSAA